MTAVHTPYIKKEMDALMSSPLFKSFLAGAFSGTCSTVLFQPFDLVKTRLQKSVNIGTKLGMVSEMVNVVKQERVAGLWNGLLPSISRCVPGIAMYFSALHWLRSTFGSDNPHPLESVWMGATARTSAGLLVLPFTVIKTRYESGEFRYTGMVDAIRVTYTTEGIRGLYSGLAPTLLRDVPFSGLYLMFYTQLKKRIPANKLDGDIAPLINFSNGLVAGCLASIITQPADVIKTNQQLYPKKYGRLKIAVVLIYEESGLLGFWRGIVPRTLRRTLMSAMAWTVYEEIMRKCHIKL